MVVPKNFKFAIFSKDFLQSVIYGFILRFDNHTGLFSFLCVD